MNYTITHAHEPADPDVGMMDDQHSIVVEITDRSSDIDEAICDAIHELNELRAQITGCD